MTKYNRYAETRGLENLGAAMDVAMKKKYGKSKEIPAYINAKEGIDQDGKQQSIMYGNSGETNE